MHKDILKFVVIAVMFIASAYVGIIIVSGNPRLGMLLAKVLSWFCIGGILIAIDKFYVRSKKVGSVK